MSNTNNRNQDIMDALRRQGIKNCESPEAARAALARIGITEDSFVSKDEMFKYVVARKWYPDDPNSELCIYSYRTEIQTGTMDDAKRFLEYVNVQSDNEKDYSIYRVEFVEVKNE
jgi:hypothetical protein